MTASMIKSIQGCRSCGNQKLDAILSLGEVPLANALLKKEQLSKQEHRFPLNLVFCENCALVQIKETVEPKILFENYFYFSSFSDAMVAHAKSLVESVIQNQSLRSKKLIDKDDDTLVIEIASNDGYLLQFYKLQGIPVLGIEPAENIAKVAREKRGIPTLVEFFDEQLAQKLADEGRKADVIHANNVFAHVPDPNHFMEGIKILLKPKGVAIIEAPYLVDFIEKVEFDTIYHEHFSYYSLIAVQHLANRHGLLVSDVQHVNIHGGSLRYFIRHASHADNADSVMTSNVEQILAHEHKLKVSHFSFYKAFAEKVHQLKNALMNCLQELKSQGKSIAAYGASAKGSTLLNAFDIGPDILDYVVDRSTVKQGHYTPGGHLPILSPDELLKEKPDYVLLLTWNFKEEILAQQSAYLGAGGKFIIPIPKLEIV